MLHLYLTVKRYLCRVKYKIHSNINGQFKWGDTPYIQSNCHVSNYSSLIFTRFLKMINCNSKINLLYKYKKKNYFILYNERKKKGIFY